MNNKVLITSSADSFKDCVVEPASLGNVEIEFIYVPLMDITFIPIEKELDQIENADNSAWMLFTSKSALPSVFDDRKFNYPLAVIGEGTHRALRAYGYEASFIPSEARAEVMASEFESFLRTQDFSGEIYIFKGTTASDYIYNYLFESGFKVRQFTSYEVTPKKLTKNAEDNLLEFLRHIVEQKSKKKMLAGVMIVLSALQGDFILEEISRLITNFKSLNEISIFEDIDILTIGSNTKNHLMKLGFRNVQLSKEQTRLSLLEDAYRILGCSR